MPALIPWPFPAPEGSLDQLGYARTVEAFDSPAMRARLAELLRRQGLVEPQPMPTGPRCFVLLHWESTGDELAWGDGVHSGVGQLDHWPWLDYRRRGPIHGWLVEHQVDLGSSEASATHALVVDRQAAGQAWIAPLLNHRRRRGPAMTTRALLAYICRPGGSGRPPGLPTLSL